MKRILSLLLAIVLALTGMVLASCGDRKKDAPKSNDPEDAMMKFIKVGEIDAVDDEETRSLLDSLKHLSSLSDSDSICILTVMAERKITIPDMYDGSPVRLVTAYPDIGGAISSLKFGNSVRYIEHLCSFSKEDPSLKGVDFYNCESILSVSDSFNRCSSLEWLTIPMSTEKNPVGIIENSFNSCKSLQRAELKGESASVSGSFNDCEMLKNVSLQHPLQDVKDSFMNCPIDIGDVRSEEELAQESEEPDAKKEAEEEKKKEEEKSRKPGQHLEELQTIIDEAWQKLADSGVIPSYSRNEDGEAQLEFIDMTITDELRFDDKSAKKRLLAEPDYQPDQVIVMSYDSVIDEEKAKSIAFIGDHLAADYEDCRYIIVYEGFESNRDTPGVRWVKDASHPYDVTTLVYIIDPKSREILSIHAVGTDNCTKYHTAEVLEHSALLYIDSLLR